MDGDDDFIVCVYWGTQSVPSLRVACSSCGRALAMSRHVRRQLPAGVKPVCFECTPLEAFRTPIPAPGALEEVITELSRRRDARQQ